MKSLSIISVVVAVIVAPGAMLLGGCDNPRDSPRQVIEIKEDLQDYQQKEVDESKRAMEERLEIYTGKLDDLKDKAGLEQVAGLREQISELMKTFEQHRDLHGAEWISAKKELEAKFDKLIAQYEQVEKSCR